MIIRPMDQEIKAPNWNSEATSNIPDKDFFSSLGTHFIDFIQTLVVFGAIFILFYIFIAQPHKVSGSSMFPTFKDGDYIITEKLSYRFNTPQRGDVIVLKNPKDESQDFIKRVIALPGDQLKVATGLVYLNGALLPEAYLPSGTLTNGRSFLNEGTEIKAGDNQYFVFGDNREHSSDSREWGPVTKEEIIGRVFLRYWPPQSFGIFKHLSD